MPDAEGLEKALRLPLTKVFPDALLNRLVVVPYYPISKEMLKSIIAMQLKRVQKRVMENHKVPLVVDPSAEDLIAARCTELERGARMVDAMITNTLLPEIGQSILNHMVLGTRIHQIGVTSANGEFKFSYT